MNAPKLQPEPEQVDQVLSDLASLQVAKKFDQEVQEQLPGVIEYVEANASRLDLQNGRELVELLRNLLASVEISIEAEVRPDQYRQALRLQYYHEARIALLALELDEAGVVKVKEFDAVGPLREEKNQITDKIEELKGLIEQLVELSGSEDKESAQKTIEEVLVMPFVGELNQINEKLEDLEDDRQVEEAKLEEFRSNLLEAVWNLATLELHDSYREDLVYQVREKVALQIVDDSGEDEPSGSEVTPVDEGESVAVEALDLGNFEEAPTIAAGESDQEDVFDLVEMEQVIDISSLAEITLSNNSRTSFYDQKDENSVPGLSLGSTIIKVNESDTLVFHQHEGITYIAGINKEGHTGQWSKITSMDEELVGALNAEDLGREWIERPVFKDYWKPLGQWPQVIDAQGKSLLLQLGAPDNPSGGTPQENELLVHLIGAEDEDSMLTDFHDAENPKKVWLVLAEDGTWELDFEKSVDIFDEK